MEESQETYSKLNLTQKIVVKLLQQLVKECTDRVPATQPYTAYLTQPVTESFDPVHSTLLILGQVDS